MTPARPIDPLLARSLKGEALPEEEATVRAWRRTAPENEIEYRQLARLVVWAARVPELIEVPPRPSAAELIAPGRLGPRVIPLRRRFSKVGMAWVTAAAAAIVLVVGTSFYSQVRGRPSAGSVLGIREIATAKTEAATFELEDGTVIRLASSSRLQVLAGRSRREVALEGRAFFAVAHDGTPFVIRTAVVEGVATATEVSTIGIVYAVSMGLLVYRQFPWRRLKPMLVETASLTGAIIFIVGCATAMAWGLTQSGFSQQLAKAMTTIPGGAHGFLAISIVAFVILGSVLEGIPAIVLFGPLLFPIARAVGVHEVHYAMIVILAMGIGLFAPPFGVGYYAACAIGRVDPAEGIRPIWGYLLALMVGLIIVAIFPWISIGFL